MKVGDPVFAHVYPSSSGAMLVERRLVGSSASNAGPGLAPRSGTASSNT